VQPDCVEFLFGIAIAYAFSRGVRWSPLAGMAAISAAIVAMIWVNYAGMAGSHWSARCLWMGSTGAGAMRRCDSQ